MKTGDRIRDGDREGTFHGPEQLGQDVVLVLRQHDDKGQWIETEELMRAKYPDALVKYDDGSWDVRLRSALEPLISTP